MGGNLKGKKPKELNLMKNEIYARYGYRFSDESDTNYFFSQNWYEPIVDNMLIELNDLKLDNIAIMELYKRVIIYKDLNKKSYSHVLPLETTSDTLYGKNALKSIKYIKQYTLGGSKCGFTEYNKKGIAVSQQNCIVNDINYVNYFKKDILIQHIDHLNDTYFYYSENGLLYKSVKLDYGTETIEETFFNYDEEGNIVKKDIY